MNKKGDSMSTEGQISIPDYAYGGASGAYLSYNNIPDDAEELKKLNPLDNANLPGGIFTHPSVC